MDPRRAAVIMALLATSAAAARAQEPAIVQHSEGAGATNIGVVQGSVTINGIDPSVLAAMAKTFADQVAATADARAQAETKAAELATKLGVTTAAAATFFRILGEQHVPEEDIAARLLEIADQFAKTKQGLAALEPEDPQSAALVRQAGDALNAGRLAEASDLLKQAQAIEMAALRQARELRQRAQEAEDRHAIKVASLLVSQAGIAAAQLQFAQTADAYEQAEAALPPGQVSDRAEYLGRAATAAMQQGKAFGDQDAVRRAIADLGRALELVPRQQNPARWAQLQAVLGQAWTRLTQLTHGPEAFDQARRAFMLALEVTARESAPIPWAAVQNGLGNLSLTAGVRERGTATLRQAVGFYRAAAEVSTRDQAPLLWAMLQENIGTTLGVIGAREGSSGRLREAVAAHELALTVRTRDKQPQEWAWTHANLAAALIQLGERSRDPASAAAALDHVTLAQQVLTRQARPYEWAMAEGSRAGALALLGRQNDDAAQLQQAAAAYRVSLEVLTPEHNVFQWAQHQNGLGRLQYELGLRDKQSGQLLQAVQTFRGTLDRLQRDSAKLTWDALQLNLAEALLAAGLNEAGTAGLEQAAAAYRTRLEHADETPPRIQAVITHGLARALAAIGERQNDPVRLHEAEAAYDRAASLFASAGVPAQAAAARSERARLAARLPP